MLVCFQDRSEAGEALANQINTEVIAKAKEVQLIVAPADGSILVASAISKKLNCPVLPLVDGLVQNPFLPNYTMAAVDETGAYRISEEFENEAEESHLKENIPSVQGVILRKKAHFSSVAPNLSLSGKNVLWVIDGSSPGVRYQLELGYLLRQGVLWIALAAPCLNWNAYRSLGEQCSPVWTLSSPDPFSSPDHPSCYLNSELLPDSLLVTELGNINQEWLAQSPFSWVA